MVQLGLNPSSSNRNSVKYHSSASLPVTEVKNAPYLSHHHTHTAMNNSYMSLYNQMNLLSFEGEYKTQKQWVEKWFGLMK